ncbi:MAG: phage major capsid protein, partial [Anaerovibrio sp.]
AIDRLERQAAIDRELDKPTSKPIVNEPQKAKPMGGFRATDEYKQDMLTAMRTRFRDISNVLQEGNDQQGGYLVPVEYDKRLVDVLNEENIMRSLATKITTSGEHKINIAATKPAAAWIEEGGALSFGDATFDQIMMEAYKLHVAIKVTEELLYDAAFNLEGYIIDNFGKALANAEEDAFLNGDGKGKPMGIFDTKQGGQYGTTTSAASIGADDIINLVYNLKRPYRKNAAFITNDKTLAALRKLKDNNGVYLWQPALTAGEPDRLFGYAIHTSQFAPEATAGKAAMAFGDFSYYNIGDRGSRSMQELKELFAGNGMVGYVMKERVDGRLILPEAVQILKMKGTASS